MKQSKKATENKSNKDRALDFMLSTYEQNKAFTESDLILAVTGSSSRARMYRETSVQALYAARDLLESKHEKLLITLKKNGNRHVKWKVAVDKNDNDEVAAMVLTANRRVKGAIARRDGRVKIAKESDLLTEASKRNIATIINHNVPLKFSIIDEPVRNGN